jgi:hypothetical protein
MTFEDNALREDEVAVIKYGVPTRQIEIDFPRGVQTVGLVGGDQHL